MNLTMSSIQVFKLNIYNYVKKYISSIYKPLNNLILELETIASIVSNVFLKKYNQI